MRKAIFFPLLLMLFQPGMGQIHKTSKEKILPVAAVITAADIAALVALSSVWYKEQPRSSFHLFNDYGEWKQMDKAGHLFSSYHVSGISAALFQNAGMEERKSRLWGSVVGFLAISQIEALDGFSTEYGASLPDLAANALGSTLAWAQPELWNENRLHLKYSFHRTRYARLRPEVLGSSFKEEMLKDYNGQTYWISVDLDRFMQETVRFPRWLNMGFGYGVENIILARDAVNPYRQYFLSLDIDLSHLNSRRKWINLLLEGVNMIHLPAPALEWNRDGMRFHWLYF